MAHSNKPVDGKKNSESNIWDLEGDQGSGSGRCQCEKCKKTFSEGNMIMALSRFKYVHVCKDCAKKFHLQDVEDEWQPVGEW